MPSVFSVLNLFCKLCFENNHSESRIAGVGDGEGNVLDSEAAGDLARRARQFQRGLAAWLADHFDIHPAHAMGPAGPERFRRGFLRGEAARKPLGAVAMLFAVGNFRRRENALDKCAAVAPDGRFDAVNFGDVQAQANDHLPIAPAAGSAEGK